MVIDLIVQLKKDIQEIKSSKNPFLKLKARREKEKLLKIINQIHRVELTCDFLKELAIFIGDFPDSNLAFTEFGQNLYIDYKLLYPLDDHRFTINIRKNKIHVTFSHNKNFGTSTIMSKFYTGAISPECADIKDRYTVDIILRVKNAIVSELYRYIDEI